MMDNRQNNTSENAAAIGTAEIVDALAAALENRRQRAERSVIGSFAEQNGMSVGELTRLLEERNRRQPPVIPDEVQSTIDARMRAADERLMTAEIREVGAQLGLVDAQAAFLLMDRSGVSVKEDGSVTGVREALEELVKSKPYLVGQSPSFGTGRTGNFPRTGSEGADYVSRLAEARRIGNNALAAAIISEAASKGVALR